MSSRAFSCPFKSGLWFFKKDYKRSKIWGEGWCEQLHWFFSMQQFLKKLGISILKKIYSIKEYNWQKIHIFLHHKTKAIATCVLILLLLPLFVIKSIRNGIQLLAYNVFLTKKDEREYIFKESLLCFNERRESPMTQNLFNVKLRDVDVHELLPYNSDDLDALVGARLKHFIEDINLPCVQDHLWAVSDDNVNTTYVSSAYQPSSSFIHHTDFLPQRLFLSNTQESREGFGNVNNYWTLGVLVAPSIRTGHMLPQIDVRWHEFADDRNANRFAANVGLVCRYIPKKCNAIWGANVYYDYRHSTIGKGWSRFGVGMEALGNIWDFRLNAYFPIGDKLHQKKCTFDDFEGDFFMTERKFEFMYSGFDTELGCRAILTSDYFLYITGGTYYINGKCHFNAWGVKLGLRPQFKDYIALDFSVTYDHIFKTIYQGQLIFSLPLYSFGSQKSHNPSCSITKRLAYQPVERLDIIPVSRVCCWDQNF
ncbi:MAG TPA: inverse autotransporter beta domain-containing protein [Rhabdochlamydiaceae bacterium]